MLFDFRFSNASRYVNLLRVPNLLWLSSFLLWFPGWLGWLVAVALMQPPSMYTKEEFHNNVLPRAAENQPPRILNDLRQLSCRLVASGIAKGLLKAEDLPEIRKTLIARFEVRAGLACVGVPVPWFVSVLLSCSGGLNNHREVMTLTRALPGWLCVGPPCV